MKAIVAFLTTVIMFGISKLNKYHNVNANIEINQSQNLLCLPLIWDNTKFYLPC